MVIQLQNQQEQERHTTKAYLKAFAEMKRRERESASQSTSEEDVLSK